MDVIISVLPISSTGVISNDFFATQNIPIIVSLITRKKANDKERVEEIFACYNED